MKRIIDTEFWLDDKVVERFTPEDRYFFLYLMTNPHTTQLGIYPLNTRVMAFETGYSLETIENLLARFEITHQVICRSKQTNEIAILNYLKHSIVKGGVPVEELLKKEISSVKDKELLIIVHDHIKDYPNLNATVKKLLPLFIDIVIDNENVVSSANRGRFVKRFVDKKTISDIDERDNNWDQIQANLPDPLEGDTE